MNLHEYQAKQLFSRYGIPVPAGAPISSISEAEAWSQQQGFSSNCVVKAQVHAGGRGKAGGVKIVDSLTRLTDEVSGMLGSRLVTAQSGAEGQPVNQVLLEETVDIAHEFYLSALIDRATERFMFVASRAGGMNIEEVAQQTPEAIFTVHVDPVNGLQAYQCRKLAFKLGLGGHIKQLFAIMQGIYRLFCECDLSLVEINPLVLTADGKLVALDAKINVDDNALYRHSDIEALRDPSQEDPSEYLAHQHGLNYVRLDGDIGCMVNGAGLAMATMDIIKLSGGSPANFLDVGGGTSAEKVAEAFKLILSDQKVKAVFINIFGGIVRCDLIAEGIIRAVQEVDVGVPVVVRLQGTNMERGRALLDESGLKIVTQPDLTQAALAVVEAARGNS